MLVYPVDSTIRILKTFPFYGCPYVLGMTHTQYMTYTHINTFRKVSVHTLKCLIQLQFIPPSGSSRSDTA